MTKHGKVKGNMLLASAVTSEGYVSGKLGKGDDYQRNTVLINIYSNRISSYIFINKMGWRRLFSIGRRSFCTGGKEG